MVSWRETGGLVIGSGIGGPTFTIVGGDGSGSAVVAQVYDAAGAKVGGEFVVNTTTTSDQTLPKVTALAAGGFVATWEDASGVGGDASISGIKAQIFDASGAKVGGEFLVNSATTNAQTEPSVTALPSGGFVISWTDASLLGGDASITSIKAQTFDAAGAKVGGEFLVNSATLNAQSDPSLVTLSSGEVAVIWTDASGQGGDASGTSIKAQLLGPVATEQIPYDLKGTILVDDIDGGAGTITVTLTVDYGILTATPGTSGGGIAGSGTNTIIVTGTLAQVQALLRTDPASTFTFTANSDDPPGGVALGVAADDGETFFSASLDIHVLPVEDAPTSADQNLRPAPQHHPRLYPRRFRLPGH